MPVLTAQRQRRAGALVSFPFALGARLALKLEAGEAILSESVTVSQEHVLFMLVGAANSVDSRVSLSVAFEEEGSTGNSDATAFLTISLGNRPGVMEQEVEVSLRAFAGCRGRFRVDCLGDEKADCRIAAWRICPDYELGLLNGLSGYDARLSREVAHFSGAAYTHAMYGSEGARKEPGAIEDAVTGGRAQDAFLSEQSARARAILAGITPFEGEPVYNFAMRCLQSLIPSEPPDFFARVTRMPAKSPLRILSICAGAARIEEMLLSYCKGDVEITLLDASEDLIQRASSRLSSSRPNTRVNCLLGDINNGLPGDDLFDIVICVSALHHVVNLEEVLSQINQRLSDDGEFWSIGEQIGRNGNRLWPEALRAANRVMVELPCRLRKNAHTNSIDSALPNLDYSIDCFEGIRSEELERKLEAYFLPVTVYKRNAFLWRLVDTTYADNYDLSSREDVGHLKDAVLAEGMHWVSGGRATELHGVYRKKRVGGTRRGAVVTH